MTQAVLSIVGSLVAHGRARQRRRRRYVRALFLLAGLQWGCHTAAPGLAPPEAVPRQPPPPVPMRPPVEDPTGWQAQARLEAWTRLDCDTLGAFAWQVAHARAAQGRTEDEALAHVAQQTRQQLLTTTTPDTVTATGLRLSGIVRLVYLFPDWTPEEAALRSRNFCLTQRAKPR
jgi:hypothetical protein